jgi:hypothetical protein
MKGKDMETSAGKGMHEASEAYKSEGSSRVEPSDLYAATPAKHEEEDKKLGTMETC